MFDGATTFNGNISSWDVSSVENMFAMSAVASAFDVDISGWNTSGVITMGIMFEDTLLFNFRI